MEKKYMTPTFAVENFAKEDIMLASGEPYDMDLVGTIVRFGMGEQMQ